MIEGSSLRGTTRMVGCSINIITKQLIDVGTAREAHQSKVITGLNCSRI